MLKINKTVVGANHFPNRETIMNSIIKSNSFCFDMTYESDNDITTLMFYKNYVEDMFPSCKTKLIMKYVPYSRMDRQIPNYVFSLKYFCKIINSLQFDSVLVLDAHSNVTNALLDRVVDMPIQSNIDKICLDNTVDYIFYPDNGAMKRYSEMLDVSKVDGYFYGTKSRDLDNGKIISLDLVNCPDIKGKTVLIIDDLCSYGGTFLLFATKLKELGAENVILYISHCERSIYEGKLLSTNFVDKIYTTDSLLGVRNSGKITIL